MTGFCADVKVLRKYNKKSFTNRAEYSIIIPAQKREAFARCAGASSQF